MFQARKSYERLTNASVQSESMCDQASRFGGRLPQKIKIILGEDDAHFYPLDEEGNKSRIAGVAGEPFKVTVPLDEIGACSTGIPWETFSTGRLPRWRGILRLWTTCQRHGYEHEPPTPPNSTAQTP